MYETYVPGFSNYLAQTALGGGGQGLPAEQPVYAEPYTGSGDWNYNDWLTGFQQKQQQGAAAQSALNDYIAQQAAQGKLYTSPIADPLTAAMLPGLTGAFGATPEEQALRYFNLDSRETTTPITFDPRTYGGGYQLVDGSGKVISTANSADQLQALLQQAGGMQGAGDVYSVQGINGDGPQTIFQQKKDAGTFGSMLLPMTGIAGLAVGLGALTGGIGGAGTGAGLAGGGGAGGTGGAAGAGLGGLAAAAPEIVVFAPSAAGLSTAGSLALGGTLAGGLAAASAAPSTGAVNYGDQLWGAQPGDPITVIGNPAASAVSSTVPGVIAGGGAIGAALPGATTPPPAPVEEIVVTAPQVQPPVVSGGLSLGDIATLGGATSLLPTITPNVPMTDIPAAGTGGGLTAGKLVDYLQLASLGIGTLGSLFGGGGNQQGGGKWPGGATPNPVFNKPLPSANLPGLTQAGAAPRTAEELGSQGLRTNQDWYRYGYGPQQSFFKHVQQAAPNTSQAYTGYAMGGTVVEGAGDGRDDKIPAMLSDGEYVIDAETVALLGNGSNKAGADLLDQFRVNVRKHKGRELARGDFSEDAMMPEQYLAGGRT